MPLFKSRIEGEYHTLAKGVAGHCNDYNETVGNLIIELQDQVDVFLVRHERGAAERDRLRTNLKAADKRNSALVHEVEKLKSAAQASETGRTAQLQRFKSKLKTMGEHLTRAIEEQQKLKRESVGYCDGLKEEWTNRERLLRSDIDECNAKHQVALQQVQLRAQEAMMQANAIADSRRCPSVVA